MFLNWNQIEIWIRKYFKIILFFLFLLFVMGASLIAWFQWKNRKEKQALDFLYQVQQSLKSLVEEESGPDKENQLFNLIKNKKEKKLVFTEEIKKKSLIYEKAVLENKKRIITVAFGIDLADFYYRYNQTKKSIEMLSLFAFPKKSSTLYHLASFQLASYYIDFDKEKGCEKAVALFSGLKANKKASAFHLESDLQHALCLEELKYYDEAMNKYESLLKRDSKGYVGRLAKDYKRLLMLDENFRNKKLKEKK